ncbi:hypothetical protein ACL02T_32190 [Pseudonocardia sp. RS010]|uniref:hypothetical protein n=1 Tax=Pseudonocardia sp. RS010 TaxID=3385979 RepID=UPI00399FF1BE
MSERVSFWDHLRRDNDPGELRVASELAARLVEMADRDPAAPLVVAVRSAVELIDARAEQRRALREAALDVRSAPGWPDRILNHIPHGEIVRRRYPPNGDPAEWARRGGAAA